MSVRGTQPFFIVRLNAVDLVTLAGMVLASASIGLMLANRRELALAVLYCAVLADAFDGPLARRFGLEREFGRYLDGFADTLIYLVAPALFVYLWGFTAWYQAAELVVMVLCGMIRLAVFNQIGNVRDERSGVGYLGLPVFWSALALGPVYLAHGAIDQRAEFALLAVALPVFSVAMLHRANYYKFKDPVAMLAILLALALLLLCAAYPPLGTHVLTALLAMLPWVVGGVLHMVVVRYGLFARLAVPLARGPFGASKTWRGLLAMPLLTVVGAYLLVLACGPVLPRADIDFARYPPALLGALLGLAYVLGELPNSFVKRRLGIAPGTLPRRHRLAFVAADQFDSIVACALVYALLLQAPPATLAAMIGLGFFVVLAIKRVLFAVGWKRTAT